MHNLPLPLFITPEALLLVMLGIALVLAFVWAVHGVITLYRSVRDILRKPDNKP